MCRYRAPGLSPAPGLDRPGPLLNAAAVLLLALVVLISAVTTGWRLQYHLAWLLLSVTAFSFLWTRLAFRGLAVLRDNPQTRIQVGDVLKERLGLRNMSFIPKPWLEVHDAGNLPGRTAGNVVSIPSASERRWRRRTLCTQRGVFTLGPLVVSASDPFGLFERSIRVGETHELLVFPQVVPLPDFALPALQLPGGDIARRRTFDSTPTVSTIRDYVAGDSLNKVSWKTTARHGKLMVKEFELDPVADVWLVLDLDQRRHVIQSTPDRTIAPEGERHYLNSSVEYAVTVAASVASQLLHNGRSVGLLTGSNGRQMILPDRGVRQTWKILEALAVAQLRDTDGLRELLLTHQSFFGGNQSVVVVTPDTSGSWRAGLEVSNGRTLPATAIYVDAVSFDPRLPRLLPQDRDRSGRFASFTLRNGDDPAVVLSRMGDRSAGGEIRRKTS